MSEPLSLLFVCGCSGDCSFFQKCLEREGCRLAIAMNAETAARTLVSPRAVSAVLIHDDGVVHGGMASGLKLSSPGTPVLLISGHWPREGSIASDVDAFYYTTSMSRCAARDIADFVRCFLVEKTPHLFGQHSTTAVRFLPGRPMYRN